VNRLKITCLVVIIELIMDLSSDELSELINSNSELKRKVVEMYLSSDRDSTVEDNDLISDQRPKETGRSLVAESQQLSSPVDLKIDTPVSKYKTVLGAEKNPKLSHEGMVALNSGAVDIHSRIMVPEYEETIDKTDLEVASLLVELGQKGKQAERSRDAADRGKTLMDSGDGAFRQAPAQRWVATEVLDEGSEVEVRPQTPITARGSRALIRSEHVTASTIRLPATIL